jgi:glycosyltransferase involved in cell wall biosynthesis
VERIVALWDGAAEVLVANFGVRAERITVIPNGVPAGRVEPPTAGERSASRSDLELPAEQPVVVFVGALSPEKGVEDLLAAALRPGDADWHVLVVGDGPQRGALERLAAECGAYRVHFLGTRADVRRVVAAADVLALTSRSESMPAALIEAGLMGLPVVATDVGAVAQIVQDGVTGRVVQIGDVPAIAEALAHARVEAEPLGEAARAHCLEHYAMAPVAAKWAEMLNDMARV